MSGHRPSLDKHLVEQALAAMSGTQPLGNHPLKFFVSVTNQLRFPHNLIGDAAVEIAVFDYLTSIISQRHAALREQYGLTPATCSSCEIDLAEDFSHRNRELEGWSVLFHRYVCIDQNLSMDMIEQASRQDGRTIRRRQALALQRLIQELIRLEQDARQTEHLQRLHLALPRLYVPALFGRASLFTQAMNILRDADPPHHLLFHGPPGIGKTVCALAISQHLLGELDDLLWVNVEKEPLDLTHFDIQMAGRLGLPLSATATPEQSLRAYLDAYNVLIVLDRAESLLTDSTQTTQVLSMLDPAQVLITSRARDRLPAHLYELSLQPLERDDAFRLVEQIAIHAPDRHNPLDWFDTIWDRAGGNPLALEVLAQRSWMTPIPGSALEFELDEVYAAYWDQLTPAARRLWLLPLICPPSGVAYGDTAWLAEIDAGTIDSNLRSLVTRPYSMPHHRARLCSTRCAIWQRTTYKNSSTVTPRSQKTNRRKNSFTRR